MTVVAIKRGQKAAAPRDRYELMAPFLVSLKDLIVPTYQRETDLPWCQKTAGEFNANLFPPIIVERSKGNKWAVNQGCHRVEIARICGIPEIWACAAKTDKPGELFVDAQQKQRNLTAFQQHHALRDDRTAQALRVDSMLREYDLRLASTNRSPGTVNGVTMFYRLMFGAAAKIGQVRRTVKPYERELRRALSAINDSWGPVKADHHSRGSTTIEALTSIFAAHPTIDDRRVRSCLANNDPLGIVKRAGTKRGLNKGTQTQFVAWVILDDYNEGLAKRDRFDPSRVERLW